LSVEPRPSPDDREGGDAESQLTDGQLSPAEFVAVVAGSDLFHKWHDRLAPLRGATAAYLALLGRVALPKQIVADGPAIDGSERSRSFGNGIVGNLDIKCNKFARHRILCCRLLCVTMAHIAVPDWRSDPLRGKGFCSGLAVKNCYRPSGGTRALPQNDAADGNAGRAPYPPDTGLLHRRPLVSRQNCMSVVSNSIINADAEARYLSPGELDQIKSFVAGGQRRLRVAQVLAESRERIVKQAGGALFQKRPDLISPGGNAYGEEMTASCLRDMDYYLRLVTYGVVAGDVTPIEEIGIIGAREMYRALGTPLEALAESVREMKSVATSILTGADAEEAGFYFDYVVGALS